MPDNDLTVTPPADKTSRSIVQHHRVRRAGSRRQAVIALFAIVVIAGLVAGAYYLFGPRETTFELAGYETAVVQTQTLQDTVELGGTVVARTTALVTAPEAGFIQRIDVNEGDWASRGDLLVQLDAEGVQDALDAKYRELERSRRDYERFLLEYQYQERSLQRDAGRLQSDLTEHEESLAEARELFAIGSVSAAEVDAAEKLVEDAEEAIVDHEIAAEETAALHRLARENYDDDIAALESEVSDLEERLAETRILAPISGRIIAIADAATTSGELIGQYETILEMADTRNPRIETEIEEQYVPLVGVGQPVSVEVAGLAYRGAVERIGQTASASSDGGTPTVEIDVSISAADSEMLPGSSAVVEILVGQVDDALVVPRGAYLTSGNRRYLYVVEGATARRVQVEYGTITDTAVEITSGVAPGDEVITSSYQSFLDRETIVLGGDE